MSIRKLAESKLFEGDVVSFNNYVASTNSNEQVEYEKLEAQKALTMLRNRLLYAKDDLDKVADAFAKFAQDAKSSYERISRLKNTFNSKEVM